MAIGKLNGIAIGNLYGKGYGNDNGKEIVKGMGDYWE